jgi:hypothetical protein
MKKLEGEVIHCFSFFILDVLVIFYNLKKKWLTPILSPHSISLLICLEYSNVKQGHQKF